MNKSVAKKTPILNCAPRGEAYVGNLPSSENGDICAVLEMVDRLLVTIGPTEKLASAGKVHEPLLN